MKKTTQKKVAEFFGVTANTIVNWGKPVLQKDEKTGEIARFYPPTGRHHLVRATELYYILKKEDSNGFTHAEKFSDLLSSIIDAIEMLNRTDGFDVDGKHVLFAETGKQKINYAVSKIKELQEVLLRIAAVLVVSKEVECEQ